MAKDKQASEANKAANLLLEELEQERIREENKKAAALRKREKKKAKKLEKQLVTETKDGDEDKDDSEINGVRDEITEDEKEKTPEGVIEEEMSNLDLNRDSGIDANSQGSATSNEKDEKSNKKKKKNKKNKEKEKNEKNLEKNKEQASLKANELEEKENSAPPITEHKSSNSSNNNNNGTSNHTHTQNDISRGESKEKSPEETMERPDSRGVAGPAERLSQPRVPCIEQQDDKVNHDGFIELPARKGRKGQNRSMVSDNGDMKMSGVVSGANRKAAGIVGAPKAPQNTDAGWKEVCFFLITNG